MTTYTPERPLRVAIIGSGPSGIYAAEALLKQTEFPVEVDVYDRLPTPYGLVRYGVAPDHLTIKSVTKGFEKTLSDPRVRFLGNVEFGRELSAEDARAHYDAVMYTVGASSDRRLNIPGEDLQGSMSATEFVAWYNGHPDAATREMLLSAEGVAVIGVGNVALDVSRILAKTVNELRGSDIAPHALPVLERSSVKDIYILGRRGPAQAAFTTKELREFGELSGAEPVVKPAEVQLREEEEAQVTDNVKKKNIEVLRDFAIRTQEGKERRVHLRFLVSPVEILDDGQGHVAGLKVERNRLDEQGNAVGTGEYETLPVQLVLRSVGYRGVALPGEAWNFGAMTSRCFIMCARSPSASPKNRRWASWLTLFGPIARTPAWPRYQDRLASEADRKATPAPAKVIFEVEQTCQNRSGWPASPASDSTSGTLGKSSTRVCTR